MWERGIRPIKAMYSSLTLIMKDFHELHSLYYTVFMSMLNYFIKNYNLIWVRTYLDSYPYYSVNYS